MKCAQGELKTSHAAAHALTHGLLERANCPEGLPFVLLKDSDKKGLRLRLTQAGGKHWQFETRIKGKLFTRALGEWPAVVLDVPVGIVAQIQVHKPSATAEKHYTVRPLELLALHHERIEAWILEQAGIVFDAKAAPGALRVVTS